MTSERKTFTLLQLTSSISRAIEEIYNQAYWVKAEMHKLNFTAKGHCYPELLQKDNGVIVAQIRGTIWKSQFEVIRKNFENVTKEPLRDGLTLLFQVRVTYHPIYGMGLNILDIDPNFTLGELQRERQETLIKLKANNLLNKNQLLKMVALPQNIAIISAESSKGLSDFMTVLNGNVYGYHFNTKIFPAILDGDNAVNTILKALSKIEKYKSVFDAVIIVRGGGGEVGLTCYNNYDLCERIANFSLPILTGIGHSTNLTVAEMIAYKNAITPTQLADFFVKNFRDFEDRVNEIQDYIVYSAQIKLEEAKKNLVITSKFFQQAYAKKMIVEKSRLVQSEIDFKKVSTIYLKSLHKILVETIHKSRTGIQFKKRAELVRIGTQGENLRKFSLRLLSDNIEVIQNQQIKMANSSVRLLDNSRNLLAQIEKNIQFVDPKNLLQKGYTITLFEGKILSDKNVPVIGSKLETISKYGKIISEVEKLEEDK